ncbi:MAG TPA: transcriptional repressor [Patescibacteria group bacterium]|nr:transcriptional repressor [Patescibacteria group bacterium]
MSPLRRGGHQHTHAPVSFVHAVEAACDTRGLKLTPMRRRVLELIAIADRPVKAYDLLDQLRPEVARAAPTQVYRALDFLIEHGFIHKLESINAYTGCHHPAERHTVPFFICDQCGAATEFCDSQVATQLIAHAHALGFTPRAQTLEVHGVCSTCRTTQS